MSEVLTSYRQILRSSSIIGGASVINILVGLLKFKVAAVLLGPAGVGLIGLFTNVMSTAVALAGMGFGNAGTRQIAEAAARDDAAAVAAARRALFWGALALAVIGAVLLWTLREPIARWVLDDVTHANDIGWLGIGVALSVASASQGALLNGLRRIGDLARVSVLGAVLSTALGIGALWVFGERGLLAFVIAAPLASFIVGHIFVARLPRVAAPPTPARDLANQWRTLVRLGFAFMVAGLVVTVAQLFVRALVQRELGMEALGYFQASWTISMIYIGFVLGAMSTDFYPRLTGVIHDHETANRLVNEQTEVALLLTGPLFLAMLPLAPWVIELLYSPSFAPAADVLRWQILGDVLKVTSWPLGFIILAAGDGKIFLMTETFGMCVFVAVSYATLPWLAVEATGIAFFALYLFYLPFVYWLARRRTGFAWTSAVVRQFIALLIVSTLTACLARWMPIAGLVFGAGAALAFGGFALIRLSRMTSMSAPLRRLEFVSREVMTRAGFRRV